MAAFAHQFVVSLIGPDGKPLRESNDKGLRAIRLPFETEYKIRLKNKRTVRAKVQVLIDGMDVSPGRMFILGPGQDMDLERFVIDGDLSKGHKFKFTSVAKGAATGEIQDPHNPKNGEIEVKFYPEDTRIYGGSIFRSSDWPSILNTPYQFYTNNSGNIGAAGGNVPMGQAGLAGASYCVNNSQPGVQASTASLNSFIPELEKLAAEAGATAQGGESLQKFTDYMFDFAVGSPVTISLYLKGQRVPNYQATAKSEPVIPGYTRVQDWEVFGPNGDVFDGITRLEVLWDLEREHLVAQVSWTRPQTSRSFNKMTEGGSAGFLVESIGDNQIRLGHLHSSK